MINIFVYVTCVSERSVRRTKAFRAGEQRGSHAGLVFFLRMGGPETNSAFLFPNSVLLIALASNKETWGKFMLEPAVLDLFMESRWMEQQMYNFFRLTLFGFCPSA